MTKKISLRVDMERSEDGTYSLSVQDRNLKGDDRYVDGISEGYETDPVVVAQAAGVIVGNYTIGQIGPVFGSKNGPRRGEV